MTRIALLVNDVFSAYQATFRAAVERAARRNACGLTVFMGRELGHRDVHERSQNVVYDWVSRDLADAVLVLSGTIANFTGLDGIAALCARLGQRPVASIGMLVPGFTSILLDNRLAQSGAAEHLIGHHRRRRIAYIGGPPSNEEAMQRLAGYRDAHEAAGISVDERLITAGHFTLPSGQRCMREMLAGGVEFDALVAANDHMALGAMDVLQRSGIRVPEDVLVLGFDDTPIARFATRSLSTVAQPVDAMAEAAVGALLESIRGASSHRNHTFGGELVLRESCGCGYAALRPAASSHATRLPVAAYARANRQELIESMQPPGATTRALWGEDRGPRLLDALCAELDGEAGAFSRLLERTIEEALAQQLSLEDIGRALSSLQERFDQAGYRGASEFEVEQLWTKARAIVSSAISRKEARAALDQIERSVDLRYVTQRLSISFESRSLAAELERSLPALGVRAAYLAVRSTDEARAFRPLLVLEEGAAAPMPSPSAAPLPRGFPPAPESTMLVWAVTFENEVLGVLAIDGAADPLVGEAIRAQIGAALKMGELHARVVEQTAVQERLAREQLVVEMATAKRIQSALAPKDLDAPGLLIAARTSPADQVGGDYHDVLPLADGCWLGIGDVTGHGIMAGLVMLMIQSIVSTLVTTNPDGDPAQLVVDVNRVLTPNLHNRLQRDEHATFALLRVFDDGRVRFAGAHEPFIVWRARARRCELVETDGTWLGLVADIGAVTRTAGMQLGPGDLLVLLTDGITEARNARSEQLGAGAVCGIVERHADATPAAILAEVMSAVAAWSPVQQDDATCVVARYTGPPSR
ncbi:MAG TPA: SpoIIE family protein phosphatase [Polyangiaceae bacterium]|nr:SpoIIE family protein phosphatase [Polyangiaceae bacterium]